MTEATYLFVARDSERVLYFGGGVLLLALLVLSYLLWRVPERERTQT